MISKCFDRRTGAVLLLMAATLGCASAEFPALSTTGAPASSEDRPWQRVQVERNGFSKKVLFRDLESPRTVVMKYKGTPIAFGSPINLIVDADLYERQSHRVRYRFQHPLSAQPTVLLARSRSQAVRNVPIRSQDAAPVVELFDQAETRRRGTLVYDYYSRILFSGEIEERRVEIERVSEDTALDKGLLKYFLFPFPVMGEFVIRVDGQEVARFTQHRQHGFTSPYDLTLNEGMDRATRDDAMLAFVVFDLMKDFVHSSAG
jgi:hypothetical protein